MATVEELKAKIAAIEAELIPLRAAHDAAKVITNQAQAAIDAVQAQPGRASLSKIVAAKNALAADPTNFALQQHLEDLNSQFQAQAAELAPLQAARDAAWAKQVKAGGAVSAKETEAGELDVEIAKIDPTQASPEAVAYLKETTGLPVNPQTDPGVKTFPAQTTETVQTQKTTTDPNNDHGDPYDTSDPPMLRPGWAVDELNIPYWVGTGQDNQIAINSPSATTDPNKDHGLPYDDAGNLMPGWSLTEEGDPIWVGNGFVEPATAASAAQSRAAVNTNVAGSTRSLTNSGTSASVTPYTKDDWRVRLSLAGSANYLYKIAGKTDILYPLIATDGVVFPYTPQINSSYRANYDPAELTHSNYKMFFYKNSSVDDISITADFTAQDTAEANYMLAVIHFFKSATKMFYGQDTVPRAGTPPPLLYLSGYGLHQFQNHPLLLTNFSYNLPNDVDYIRAGSNAQWGGVSIAQVASGSSTRLNASGLTPGGTATPTAFSGIASQDKVTYVPTKISLSLTFSPVVTRNDISKNFSVKDYAAGKFSGRAGGGIW